MSKSERTAAILVAAGRGLRAGAGGPKQYREIGGRTVIYRAMEAFCRDPQVFAVQPVLNPDDAAVFNEAVSGLRHAPPTPADGDKMPPSPDRSRSGRRSRDIAWDLPRRREVRARLRQGWLRYAQIWTL